ncbi:MAG TPA: hypothetical protein DD438_01720 [Verrucomicrobiales bacterium]|nr:hypothetical protein [Verrucomicrobiales bacterium]
MIPADAASRHRNTIGVGKLMGGERTSLRATALVLYSFQLHLSSIVYFPAIRRKSPAKDLKPIK